MSQNNPRLEIRINDGPLLAWLSSVQAAATDMRPFFRAAGAYMLEISGRAFRTATSPLGVPWKPLAQSTLESRYLKRLRSTYTGGAPLRRTGMMMNSITVLDLKNDTVAVGSTLKHAAFHNSPPVSPRRRYPQRAFLQWPPEAQGVLTAMAMSYLRKAASGSGGSSTP